MLQRSPILPLNSIQILRALAALAIVVHHALHDADTLARRAGSHFDWQSHLPLQAGVDLFFVISGFVMVHSAHGQFGNRRAILPFLRRRLARIVPIYWAATGLFLLTLIMGIGSAARPFPSVSELAASFLFVPHARPDGVVQPLFGLGWTLNYEMMFYVLFALFLPLRRSLAVPALVGTLMGLMALGQFLPAGQTALYFWTRPIILEFGFGMVIGHMALSGVRPGRGLAAGLIVLALILLVSSSLLQSFSQERALIHGLPAAMLVMAALGFDADGSGAGARPFLKFLTRLGDASYALYLLHPFVLRGLAVAGGGTVAAVSPLLFVIAGVTLSTIVAMMVWRWFEKPLTKALQGPRTI